MGMKYNKSVYLTGVLLYFLSGPFFMWPLLRHYSIRYIITAFMCFIFFLNKKKSTKDDYKAITLLVGSILLLGLTNPDNIFVNMAITLLLLPLIFIPLANSTFTKNVYHVFETIYVYSISAALVCWIASLIGVLPSMGKMSGLISQLGDNAYDIHLFCVRLNAYETPRFYGPYDEPGVVGTLAAILLVINGFNLRLKKNIIILITGVLSLSLYFFLIVGFYFFYRAIVQRKIIPLVILVASIFFIYEKTKDIPELQWRVWNRLTIEDGRLAGNDRNTDYIEELYDSKFWTSEYWFGVSDWYALADRLDGSSSYKIVVLKNGMLFFSLYCLFFIVYSFLNNKHSFKEFLLFVFVFISCMYQRAYLYHGLYFFLFCYYARFASELSSHDQLVNNEKNTVHRRLCNAK